MKLIAKKPCSFGGEKFYIGDEIPMEYVLDPVAQERLGVLAIVKVDDAEGGQGGEHECPPQPIVISDPTLTICVHVNGEDLELEPTDNGLQDIFNVLLSPPKLQQPSSRRWTTKTPCCCCTWLTAARL